MSDLRKYSTNFVTCYMIQSFYKLDIEDCYISVLRHFLCQLCIGPEIFGLGCSSFHKTLTSMGQETLLSLFTWPAAMRQILMEADAMGLCFHRRVNRVGKNRMQAVDLAPTNVLLNP